MNTDWTGIYNCKECHKAESRWNHTTTDHKKGEQLEDRRNVGENSCNYGDGTDQSGPILNVYGNMQQICPGFNIVTRVNGCLICGRNWGFSCLGSIQTDSEIHQTPVFIGYPRPFFRVGWSGVRSWSFSSNGEVKNVWNHAGPRLSDWNWRRTVPSVCRNQLLAKVRCMPQRERFNKKMRLEWL